MNRKIFLLLLFFSTPSFGAMNFSGAVGEYIQIADHNDFSFGNGTSDTPFSLAAWVYYDNTFTGYTSSPIIAKWTSLTDAEWSLLISSVNLTGIGAANVNNCAAFQINTSGGVAHRFIQEGRTPFKINGWTHVVATYDGSSTGAGLKIYIDGIQDTTDLVTNGTYVAMSNFAGTVDIGAFLRTSPSFDGFLKGQVDDVRIYSRVLSDGEIASLGKSRVRLDITDRLIGYWRLDQGNDGATALGATVFDSSGNGRSGTATAGPGWRASSWISYTGGN